MNIQLRPAEPNDAERVADILIDSRRTFLPFAPSAHTEEEVREWVRAILLPSGGVTLAVEDRETVGVLAISQTEGVTWLDQLYLDPEYIGRGIGTIMLENLLQNIQEPLRLYTFQENQGARRFYERHGFQAIQFTNGEDNEEQCPDVLYELPATK